MRRRLPFLFCEYETNFNCFAVSSPVSRFRRNPVQEQDAGRIDKVVLLRGVKPFKRLLLLSCTIGDAVSKDEYLPAAKRPAIPSFH